MIRSKHDHNAEWQLMLHKLFNSMSNYTVTKREERIDKIHEHQRKLIRDALSR